MEENLKRKTTKALVWSTADKLGQQLFYLVAGIILARQLSPEDYGKVGVLTIFIALSGILIDSGFSSALIRKKEATQADYSTVFYVNVAISCVLYGLLYAAAPYIAVFFKVPDLIYICRILFLVIPLNALSLIQQTLLLKHFKLSVSARVNLWSLGIASVVAIAMALIAICASLHRFYRALSYPSRGTFARRAYDGCKTTPFETKTKKYLQRRVPTYKLKKDRRCGFK